MWNPWSFNRVSALKLKKNERLILSIATKQLTTNFILSQKIVMCTSVKSIPCNGQHITYQHPNGYHMITDLREYRHMEKNELTLSFHNLIKRGSVLFFGKFQWFTMCVLCVCVWRNLCKQIMLYKKNCGSKAEVIESIFDEERVVLVYTVGMRNII